MDNLIKLALGVALAAIVYAYRFMKKTTLPLKTELSMLGDALAQLLIPAGLLFAGLIVAGSGYTEAGTSALLAAAVALGLNRAPDKQP